MQERGKRHHIAMEALGVNTWFAPFEISVSEAFLVILSNEFRGVKNVNVELRPLHRNDVHCAVIEKETLSTFEVYHLMTRSCN